MVMRMQIREVIVTVAQKALIQSFLAIGESKSLSMSLGLPKNISLKLVKVKVKRESVLPTLMALKVNSKQVQVIEKRLIVDRQKKNLGRKVACLRKMVG